jgi:uncharacterized protein
MRTAGTGRLGALPMRRRRHPDARVSRACLSHFLPPAMPHASSDDLQDADRIVTIDRLRALYPAPRERAVRKELAALDVHCRRFIALSPFVVIASAGIGTDRSTGGLDASPRGGRPGFVQATDAHTLLIPDAPGNNRLDTLENIAATGAVGLLFLIPGIDETLRVNGRAVLSVAPGRLGVFDGETRRPKLVIEVTVTNVYLHCAKAFLRSKLWQAAAQQPRSVLPTMGRMINDQTGIETPAETDAEMLARYAPDL